MRLLKMTRSKLIAVGLVLAVLFSLTLIQRSGISLPDQRPFRQTKAMMGTLVEITVIPAHEQAIQEAFAAIKRVNNLMSIHREDSEISILNKEGQALLSPSTLEVIRKALKFSELTGGSFDITCKPLMNLWRRARKEKRIPSEEEIKEALSLVGWEKIILKENQVSLKKKGMQIDLGGIAKGYAVDRAIEALRKKGIRQALVNIGGDIYALGDGPRGEGWLVGIQDPRKMGEILEIIKIKDQAVATSGDYRKYFTLEGRRFSHIVDPDTGLTVQDVPISVTIIGPDAITTDALTTGIFVLGPEEGMKLIESLPGIEGMIISEGMKESISSGWEQFLR